MVKTTIDLRRLLKNGKYRVISVADVEQNTQRKIVRHWDKCRRCGNLNNYQSLYRTKLIATVGEEDSEEDESYKICTVDEDSRPSINKALVDIFVSTKKPGNQVRFQVDTGSECNLLPTKLYKSLTGDTNLSMLRKCNKSIVSYTGERRQIAGKINLRVWHKRSTQTLTFNVIDGEYQPILSLNISIAFGIVLLQDSDVLSLTISSCSNAILEEFKDVFEGPGELPGDYKIITDETVKPKVHPPRRVLIAVRPKIKEKLDELVQRKVITSVTEPTEWVSSMLAAIKPNKIRICLDPRDLNEAIRREHYQMPTIEEVATRLNRAKLFTVVDAKDVFWQKRLDLESSYKTTFNTPFRHYRWLRMPFGISSAPEVRQRTMHEFIEGLQGVEVIADDFIIAGFGDTKEEAYKSLEQNERFFFTTCREWNLKLNHDKVKRAQTKVRFMGHKLTPEGLKPDPAKVEAITAMPEPDNVTALKCFLGMVNYWSNFMPHLSEMTEPLRRLEDKDAEWQWL